MSPAGQVRQSLDTAVGRIAEDVERHLSTLVNEWTEAAAREQQAAVETARQAVEPELERRVQEALENARREWDAAQVQTQAEVERSAREDARRVLEPEVERRIHEAVEAARADLEARHAQALTDVERLAEDRVRRAQIDADAQGRAVQIDAERRLQEALASWGPAEEELRADLKVAQDQAAEALQTLAATERSVRAAERETRLAGLERLLQAVERLDRCSTLKATLDALAESVAGEAARSVTFVVRGQDLQGWHLKGFTEPPDLADLKISLASSLPLANVVRDAATTSTSTDQFENGLAFIRLSEPCMGLAVPVTLGKTVVGVVYADDSAMAEREVPAGWPEIVQVLARHASRQLEALTATRAVSIVAALPHAPHVQLVHRDAPDVIRVAEGH
jgi:hypothetical protein